jgi:hypothetical protein
MKRPIGVTIIAVVMFFGATILALGSVAFFFVAVMGMTGGDAGEPVSVAISGMGVTGGFSLLILGCVAVCIAMGVLELRKWARVVSITSVTASIGYTIFSLFAFRRYAVIPVVPSIVCHLIVLTTAGWALTYLLRPQIKQAFSAVTG